MAVYCAWDLRLRDEIYRAGLLCRTIDLMDPFVALLQFCKSGLDFPLPGDHQLIVIPQAVNALFQLLQLLLQLVDAGLDLREIDRPGRRSGSC